jgi:hypothetical protein
MRQNSKFKIQNLKKILLIFFLLTVLNLNIVQAQTLDLRDIGETGTGEDLFQLKPIEIVLFPSPAFITNASLFSWLAYAGNLVVIGLFIFWIFKIIQAGIGALRSNGDQKQLEDSYKKVKANFIGIFITFLFPIILSAIGIVLGVGNIFQWPQMFSFCEVNTNLDGTEYQFNFYFQAYLRTGDKAIADAICTPTT